MIFPKEFGSGISEWTLKTWHLLKIRQKIRELFDTGF